MKENLKPCVYKLWKDYDVAQSRLTRTTERLLAGGEVVSGRRERANEKELRSLQDAPKS